MEKKARRTHSPAFKAKVAIKAKRDEKTLKELAKQHDMHSNQIVDWKSQIAAGANDRYWEI